MFINKSAPLGAGSPLQGTTLCLAPDWLCLVCSKKEEMHSWKYIRSLKPIFLQCDFLFSYHPWQVELRTSPNPTHIVLQITPCLQTTEALLLRQMVISDSQRVTRRLTLAKCLVLGLPEKSPDLLRDL